MTGGDGFVGGHLIAHLLDAGDRVAATHLAERPRPGTLGEGQAARVRWSRLDVLEREAVADRLRETEPDCIYHLAGFSSSALARLRPAEALRVNAEGTLTLLDGVEAVRDAAPGRDPVVLVVGSADAYGRPRRPHEPIHEDEPLRPESSYGLSKAAQELVARTYRDRGIRVVIARLFNLLGPGQDETFAVPTFCAQAAAIAAGEMEPVLHVGNLDVERDFTDVRDGARALRLLAERGDPGPFNVGSGRPVPIRRLIEWILDAAGIDPAVRVDPERVRPDEPRRVVADPSRIREAVGWRAETGLPRTVRDAYRWYAERRRARGREGGWTSR